MSMRPDMVGIFHVDQQHLSESSAAKRLQKAFGVAAREVNKLPIGKSRVDAIEKLRDAYLTTLFACVSVN